GRLGILAGRGDGTFSAPTTFYNVGNAPTWITSGEFNHDGVPDIAVADFRVGLTSTSGVMVLLSGAPAVTPADPAIVAQGATTLLATAGVALNNVVVASFVDPDITSLPEDYSATIDFGDNPGAIVTTPGTIVADPLGPGRFLVRGSHTYAAAGAH